MQIQQIMLWRNCPEQYLKNVMELLSRSKKLQSVRILMKTIIRDSIMKKKLALFGLLIVTIHLGNLFISIDLYAQESTEVTYTIWITGRGIDSSGLNCENGNCYTDYTVEYRANIDREIVEWQGSARLHGNRSWYGYYFHDNVEVTCNDFSSGVKAGNVMIPMQVLEAIRPEGCETTCEENFDELAKEGVWVKDGDFVQINILCLQVWVCAIGENVLTPANRTLITTNRQTTTGGCAAGGGAIDQCNICIVNPPRETCKWAIVPDEVLDQCSEEIDNFRSQ